MKQPGEWVQSLLLACVYALLATFSYGVSNADSVPLIWLPTSVAVAWGLVFQPRPPLPFYLAIAVASTFSHWLYSSDVLVSLQVGAIRLLTVAAGVFWIRSLQAGQPTVRSAATVYGACFAALFPAAAVLGGTLLWLNQDAIWQRATFDWWLGETIGAVLLLLPALQFRRLSGEGLLQSWPLSMLGLQWLGLFVVSLLALTYLEQPFPYLTLPLLTIALLYGMLRVALLANLAFLLIGAGIAWGWWALPAAMQASDPRALWSASAVVIFGPIMLGLAMDEIRRRQHDLARLEERLNLAAQSVDLGLWDWDMKSGEIYWDHRMFQLYGMNQNEPTLDVERWQQRIHPDDEVSASASLADALAGKSEYNTQFRVMRPDGSYRVLQGVGIVVRDEQGEPVRMVGLNWDVSEVVSARHAVQHAEEKLNSVIEAASEFAIISADTKGTVEVFSAGAERLLGYQRDEIIGKTSPAIWHVESEVVAEGERLSKALGYRVEGFEVFVAQAKQGQAVSREWQFIRKDGQAVPVNLTVTAIRTPGGSISGYLGVARNIIQQKVAEKEIRAAHNVLEQQIQMAQQMRDEFESLFELAPGAMLVLNEHGAVVKANSRAHQLFRCDANMHGRKVTEFLPAFERYGEVGQRAELGVEEEEWTAHCTDGKQLTVSLEYSPLLLNGVVHTILNVYDITEQKAAERALQRSRDLAESANRSKTEFLANMSHEIRTPLNAVLGAAQLLSYTSLDKKQSNHVGMISAAGQALLALLNDVLDVSKIEAGKMDLTAAPFSLNDVLEPLATIMTGSATKKRLELVIAVAPNVPQHFIGDAMRVQQVLVNLAGNAIKFTAAGEVVVQFSAQVDNGAAVLTVSVRDTGIGMDAEQQARLFSAFSQGDTSITRRFGGTGLGLTICKKLVELMDGAISVVSAPGQGSTFTCQMRLPLDAEHGDEASAVDAPRHLLLVEPNAAAGRAVQGFCEAWHWQCDVVTTVAAAEAALTQATVPYDVLIYSHSAEGSQQLEAWADRLPCVKLMGSVSSTEGSRMVMLSKPVTPATLLGGVNEALSCFSDQGGYRPAVAREELPRLDGVNLLLVEDTPSNQVIIVGVLEEAGARVDVVENGAEAVAALSQPEAAAGYDAVLMDVQMPIMDGFTATQTLRGELGLTLPIIAMTAGVLAFERQQCLDSGMTDFIGKPLDIPKMLATIGQHVTVKAVPAPAPQDGPQAAEPVVPETVPVVDGVFNPERLMGFARGKPEREKDILDMIERVVLERQQPVDEGRALLAADQMADAARHFHTLKGTMGNFGAERVMKAAQALELAIKEQQGDYEPLLLQFADALQEMLAVASVWLGQYRAVNDAPEAEEVMDAAALQAAVVTLKALLEECNMEALDQYNRLKTALAEQLDEADAKALAAAMEDLRFDEAAALLAAL